MDSGLITPTEIMKREEGDSLYIDIKGSLDESCNFEKQIGPFSAKKIFVTCKGISRMNSAGIKDWITYFSKLSSAGIELHFRECSPSLFQQMFLFVNSIAVYSWTAFIESAYTVFLCTQCHHENLKLFQASEIKNPAFQFNDQKCEACGGPAIFDDLPEIYFNVFRRK